MISFESKLYNVPLYSFTKLTKLTRFNLKRLDYTVNINVSHVNFQTIYILSHRLCSSLVL